MIDLYQFWQDFYTLPPHLTIIYDILTFFLAIMLPLAIFYPFMALISTFKGGRR
jgi:hypothetical protein